MRTLRNAFLTLSILLAVSIQAQYFVNISGHHTPCDPSVADGFVYIESLPGTLPEIAIDVPINENCFYTITLEVTSDEFGFQVFSGCATSITAIVGDSALGIPPGSTVAIVQDFDCSGQTVDCLGVPNGLSLPGTPCITILNEQGTWNSNCQCIPEPVDCLQIPNGPNVPGSPCNTPQDEEGTWSANCECVPNTNLSCEAGFWVIQAYQTTSNGDTTEVEPIPFELWVWNLSSGGTGNYSFVWDFGDGNSSTDAFPTHVYAASGPYTLCLTITDDAGCTSTYCEDIEVDQDGILGMGTGFDVRSLLTIRVIQELPTSITEQASLEATKLWPNPVVEQFNLTLNSSRSGNLTLSIVDLNGREVRTMNASVMAGTNQLPMDVSGLESGMYVLRLSNGSNSAAMRFVKH